jgi:hypothetical protein
MPAKLGAINHPYERKPMEAYIPKTAEPLTNDGLWRQIRQLRELATGDGAIHREYAVIALTLEGVRRQLTGQIEITLNDWVQWVQHRIWPA